MPFEIGVMFSAGADLPGTLRALTGMGVRHGQMAVPGDVAIDVAGWSAALRDANFEVHTLFGVYEGESYADIDTVQRSVGFVPRATRQERIERTLELMRAAAELGIPGFATHVGFLPEDPADPEHAPMVETVRLLADAAARHGLTFALETGQETAGALLDFLVEVDRDNVGVNFDPANMILYGTGDPVEALDTVGQHCFTVHCKDGTWPAAAGMLGTETPIGQGQVDFRAFLTMLRKIGYEGPLFIERETEDRAARLRDIAGARTYLDTITADI